MTEHSKSALRQEALKKRAAIDIHAEPAENCVDLFFQAIRPSPNAVFSFYVPVNKELDCWPLFEAARSRGYCCTFPIIQKNSKCLLFAPVEKEADFEDGPYKIPQPKHQARDLLTPDVVIVPLLAFDRRGSRLGMGGGYYDATLQKLREEQSVLAVGLAHAEQACIFNLPTEDHDEKLDWVITPQQAHYFGKYECNI